MIGSGIEHGPPHSVVRPDFVHDPPLFTQVNSVKKMMNNDFFNVMNSVLVTILG